VKPVDLNLKIWFLKRNRESIKGNFCVLCLCISGMVKPPLSRAKDATVIEEGDRNKEESVLTDVSKPEKPYPLDTTDDAETDVLELLSKLDDFKPSFAYLVNELDSPPHVIGRDLEMYVTSGVVVYHGEEPPRYSHRKAHEDVNRSIENSVLGPSKSLIERVLSLVR